jgi:hypothetical protein
MLRATRAAVCMKENYPFSFIFSADVFQSRYLSG